MQYLEVLSDRGAELGRFRPRTGRKARMAILGFWLLLSLMAAAAAEAVRIQLDRMMRH